MQAGPLPQKFGRGARVFIFVGGDASEMVGGHIADAIAGGLDRVHLDVRESLQNVRHIDQLGPVVLQVLPRREMTVAVVPFVGDVGEAAHLPRRERAIGDGDAQHIGVQLKIEPVHQAEGPKLVLGRSAREAAANLLTKLGDALPHEGGVIIIIEISRGGRVGARGLQRIMRGHAASPARSVPDCLPRSGLTLGPLIRIFSR